MPRFDGTGPMGRGRMTGRGMGFCNVNSARRNNWFCRRGFGLGRGFMNRDEEKKYLENQKALLEEELKNINKYLDSYK
ncbi:DUF5320 domain-containing protein [Tepidibacter thalassicus]|uniref:DUF5320 domain-containing protein n=1 Tax=Tepidibacter thalassicus DSM 15285 TaxID=1123350 RepID=A0A1M5QZB5_9FIRM|nr:DUF5320 domain-containing protein [Tepidibacter thalassicus]SHH19432.1 hypothetical protein SAMN02744040_01163 [Tepidibacter thalassicus DSM 15285]